MRSVHFILCLSLLTAIAMAEQHNDQANHKPKPGQVIAASQGLHGYIGYTHEKPDNPGEYGAGIGFYAAVWPLIDQPIAHFQIGLPGTWIIPDNSDNTDTPLAPEGTLARKWKPRGPTWASVFQTVEGGLGYWARNHYRYGPPKFSMNATPQCYDYELATPGWSFFYDDQALPDDRLGIAQLSNRLLIPPDALPFAGNPNGEFLGYTYMALPFTAAYGDDPPTGDQSWTCFLSAANFKGPIAFYIPETWSKIGKLFDYPFIYGRGLDARPGIMGGGAMEINTVPRLDGRDADGNVYTKIPKLQWPIDEDGRAYLVQDVTFYSKAALYEAFKTWRDGGAACDGRFDTNGTYKPKLIARTTRYDQAKRTSPALNACSTPGSSTATSGAWNGSIRTSAPTASFHSISSRWATSACPWPRTRCPPRRDCTTASSRWPSRARITPRPTPARGSSPARSPRRSSPNSPTVRS
jgi:hypothetical protein